MGRGGGGVRVGYLGRLQTIIAAQNSVTRDLQSFTPVQQLTLHRDIRLQHIQDHIPSTFPPSA